MKFRDLAQHFQDRLRQKSVERAREKGLRRYRASGEQQYPRLLGYRRTANGIEVVEDQATSVRIIFGLLALGRSLAEIKKELDKRGERNASGDRFCEDEIKRIAIKPVYMGKIAVSGKMIDSKHYEPLISPEIWRKVQKNLKKMTEGSNSLPLRIGERVVLTLADDKPCPDTKWDFLGLP